jgi:hypothetical protein
MKYVVLASLLFTFAAHAGDIDYTLVIKDHRFEPTEITIPSGKKIKLQIDNQDATPEEFDSSSLNREKIVAGHGSATIFIGPLTPGRYPFTGEFHADTAHGVVIAK